MMMVIDILFLLCFQCFTAVFSSTIAVVMIHHTSQHQMISMSCRLLLIIYLSLQLSVLSSDTDSSDNGQSNHLIWRGPVPKKSFNGYKNKSMDDVLLTYKGVSLNGKRFDFW